jgi:hypothetical protein
LAHAVPHCRLENTGLIFATDCREL